MKTLYLHIGQPKTGTTTLQHFLAANSTELEAQGLAYPLMPFRWGIAVPERNARFLSGPDTDASGVPLDQEERERRNRCLDIVGAALESHDAVLLSDENLWARTAFGNTAFLHVMHQLASAHGCDVKVIAFLRRPDRLAMSMYSEHAKFPLRKRVIPWKHWLERQGPIFDALPILESISTVIGRDNVIVRVYAGNPHGDRDSHALHDEFLGCLGLERTDAMDTRGGDKNTSRLTPNYIACMNAVKRSPSFIPTPDKNNIFIATACDLSAAPSDTPRIQMFSAEEARADDHARIARDYLHTTGPLFDDTYPDVRKWTPGNRWLKADALRYFCEVARRQNALAGYDEYDEYDEFPAVGDPTSDRPSADALRHMMSGLAEELCARQNRIDAGDSVEVLTCDYIRSRGEELL